VAGTTTGHSVAFSWDGKVLIFGSEPGGGSQATLHADRHGVPQRHGADDPAVGCALKLGHLNPQTQEFTLG
jgi:hypothetical protein